MVSSKLSFCDKLLSICEDAKTYGLFEDDKDRATCDTLISFFKTMQEFYADKARSLNLL